jgi:hypothetical protein
MLLCVLDGFTVGPSNGGSMSELVTPGLVAIQPPGVIARARGKMTAELGRLGLNLPPPSLQRSPHHP